MLLKTQVKQFFLCKVDNDLENLSKGICLSDTFAQAQLKIRISRYLLVTSRDQHFFLVFGGIHFSAQYFPFQTSQRKSREGGQSLLAVLFTLNKEPSENILCGNQLSSSFSNSLTSSNVTHSASSGHNGRLLHRTLKWDGLVLVQKLKLCPKTRGF